MLAGFLAVLSAATFALNNASLRRGVLTGSVAQAMAITVPFGLPIFLLAAVLSGTLASIAEFSVNGILVLAAAGLVHFLWGRYCNYRATRAMGTNLTAPLQQVNLIISLLLAIVVLGESLTALKLLGIGLVLLGPYFALRSKSRPALAAAAADNDVPAESKPPPFQPRYAEGALFAVLSATGYGSSPILVRIGLEGKGLAAAIPGGLIAYAAATVVLALIMLWPGQFRHALAVKPESARWFAFSGVLVSMSQMFLFMAVAIAPVTVVSPISRLSILFRLYFSRLLNPHHEIFGGGIILGTVISLLGAVILSVSTQAVTALVPVPDTLAPILQWHWP